MVVSITLLKHLPPNSTDVISSRILSFVFFFVSSLHLDLKVFIGEFHHWWNLLKYKAWSEDVEPAEVVEHTAILFARMSKREKDHNVFKANSRTCLIGTRLQFLRFHRVKYILQVLNQIFISNSVKLLTDLCTKTLLLPVVFAPRHKSYL